MRNKFSEILSNLAAKNKKIFIVVADISPAGKMEEFQKKYKNRFINVGVAEQTMVGLAAGLAIKGAKPFIYTIATFSIYRPFEMIRDDLCYQNLPVTIVGMGAGTIYSSLGGTHMTQEDVSICRSIPNMRIISPCDPDELVDAVKYCSLNNSGPIYLRIGKSGEKKLLTANSDKWKFGKLRKLYNGQEICIIGHGPILSMAVKIRENTEKRFSIYSSHTLKPFDKIGMKKIFQKYHKIITIEDHSIIGGLSSIIKEQAFNFKYKGKIVSFALKDKFLNSYESQVDLLKLHGIDEKKILNEIVYA